MISTAGSLLRSQIKLAKPLLKHLDIEASRTWQDRLGEWGARALKDKVEYRMERFECFEADWALPCGRENDGRAILYLHGGSYTAGSLYYARGFGGILADETGIPTLCVGYRLAPEHPYPAALNDALCAYVKLLDTYKPDELAVVGESAGGGLTLALLLKIKSLGLPQPACAVALSPWADLTCAADSYESNAENDPSLFADALRDSAELYADGVDRHNPFISPIFGDLHGLPPVSLYAGTDELLLDDTLTLQRLLKESGVECEARFGEGLWHVYVIYGIPEAKKALAQICEFINEHVKAENGQQKLV